MSTIERDLSSRVLKRIADYRFPDSRKLVVAYSGGPDSAALLDILSKSAYAGRTSAFYVDHALRPPDEMEQERTLVEQFCGQMHIPLRIAELEKGSVHARAHDCGIGVEASAREMRYRAFMGRSEELDGAAVLTAHTLDDQAETLVMRVFQGSSLEGLAGIPEVREPYYRPLLHEQKSALLDYLTEHLVPSWTDSTNELDVYTRNRVRGALEEIETIYPGYRKALDTLRMKIKWALESLDSIAPVSLPGTFGRLSGSAEFPLSWFLSLQPYTRMQVLYRIWGDHIAGDGERQLAFASIRPFLEHCRNNLPGDSVFSAGGSTITIQDGIVLWNRGVAHNRKKRYLKSVQYDSTPLFNAVYLSTITSSILQPGAAGLIREELADPLIVRSAAPGDAMTAVQGTKHLSALFSDWKVPPEDRWKIPVLEDRRGVQAVLGAYFGYADRVAAAHTRQLRQHEHYVLCSIQKRESV